MNRQCQHFTVTPSVVPAGQKSTVTIFGQGEYYRFFDDVTYTVTVCAKDFHDTEIDEDFTLSGYDYPKVTTTCQEGRLSFSYLFTGEQEWELVVSASEEQRKHLNRVRLGYDNVWDLRELERGIPFHIYSLDSDLYEKRVYCGDLHMHSDASDGQEPPELVCANYRGFGYDFCAITDHHFYASSLMAQKRLEELNTGFTVFPGEEVHNKYFGRFHVVNFNGAYSVNDLILKDRETVKAQVKEKAKKLDGVTGRDAEEIAWYQWITEAIRKSGGLSIFAHPYWSVRHCYNCPTHIAVQVMKRGYFDAFEVLGGCSPEENNMQMGLYQELRSEGVLVPAVGSTDVHCTLEHGFEHCASARTLVFASSPQNIQEEITALQSVAVETLPGETKRVYGPLRLVKYAQFLLQNYYPLHDKLCRASGTVMGEYYKGDQWLKPAVELIEEKLSEQDRAFFGR